MKYLSILLLLLAFCSAVAQEDADVGVQNAADMAESGQSTDEQGSKKDEPIATVPSQAFVPEKALERFKALNTESAADKQAKRLYRQAHEYQVSGDYMRAISTYKQVVRINPDHEQARISLAQIFAVRGDYSNALSTLIPLTKNPNSHWSAWYWIGISYMKQGAYDLAIQATEEALSRELENIDLWLLRALIEQESGDHHSALLLLSAAEQLVPNHPLVVLNKAISNEAIGQNNLALISYSKYLELVQGKTERRLSNSAILARISRLRAAN